MNTFPTLLKREFWEHKGGSSGNTRAACSGPR